MSTFTLQGPRGDRTVQITWTDGRLTGDLDAIRTVQMLALSMEGKLVASPADMTMHDHLENPASASSLMRMVFSRPPECVYSDVPPVPDPPEGAVM
jgi:hypothetical protein